MGAVVVGEAFVDVAYKSSIQGNLALLSSINGIESFVNGGTLDTNPLSGDWINGTNVAGNAAFAYYRDTADPNDGLLIYNRNGPGGFAPVVAAGGFGTFDYGYYSSLAVIAGRPAIAFYDREGQRLLYIRAEDAEGSVWPSSVVTIEAGGIGIDSGISPILMEVDGRPAVVYGEAGLTDRVMYKRADDTDGTSWPGAGVLVSNSDSFTQVNPSAGAASFGDRVGVAYIHDTLLCYREAADSAGNFSEEEVVDVDYSLSPVMAIIEGRPAIAYYSGGISFAIKY
jgi:hypothetical protein